MIDLSRVRRASDPLGLRKRKSRMRPAVALLLIGGAALTLSYRDVQASAHEQRREAVLNQQYLESGSQKTFRFEPIVLSVSIFLSSGTSWVVPSDCAKLDTVDCIGGGGNGTNGGGGGPSSGAITGGVGGTGGNGGAGGGWARKSNVATTPLSSITYSIGVTGVAHSNFGGICIATSASGASPGGFAAGDTGLNGGSGSGGGGLRWWWRRFGKWPRFGRGWRLWRWRRRCSRTIRRWRKRLAW